MRRAIRFAALLALAVALGGPACTTTSQPGPARPVQTSYPSPDYPAQAAPAAQVPAAPAAPGGPAPKLAERPLTPPPPAAAAPAPAAAPPVRDGRFDAMDADHNGRITLEEWRNFQEREFRRIDANDDGVITREEMDAPPRKNVAPAARPRP